MSCRHTCVAYFGKLIAESELQSMAMCVGVINACLGGEKRSLCCTFYILMSYGFWTFCWLLTVSSAFTELWQRNDMHERKLRKLMQVVR